MKVFAYRNYIVDPRPVKDEFGHRYELFLSPDAALIAAFVNNEPLCLYEYELDIDNLSHSVDLLDGTHYFLEWVKATMENTELISDYGTIICNIEETIEKSQKIDISSWIDAQYIRAPKLMTTCFLFYEMYLRNTADGDIIPFLFEQHQYHECIFIKETSQLRQLHLIRKIEDPAFESIIEQARQAIQDDLRLLRNIKLPEEYPHRTYKAIDIARKNITGGEPFMCMYR